MRKNTCYNCNSIGHKQEHCKRPITSWGIILISHDFTNLSHYETNLKDFENLEGIKISSKDDFQHKVSGINNIKFLLIQRKHSLGFGEFIKGKYNVNKLCEIKNLFKQMNKNEIEKIRTSTFDQLWADYWSININSPLFPAKEMYGDSAYPAPAFYHLGKKSFEELQQNEEYGISFFDGFTPDYLFNEWGFPKGRKDSGESGLDCALREFTEETGIPADKINILHNISPIEEEFNGTNNLPYKHIYYLAELKDKSVSFDNFLGDREEVGGIGFYNYLDTKDLIRDYHLRRHHIIEQIVHYYLKITISYENDIWIK